MPVWTTNTGFGCNTSITASAISAGGISGQVALANGGTNANLTASAGGIFYSTGSAGAILSGTSTANQMLLSGSSTTPAWSTATWPATTTANALLYSSAPNTVAQITPAANSVLVTNGSSVPAFSATLPSSMVQFLQSGTGAVQRALDARLQDWISVMDFCTAGQVSTDATACTQAAINQAQAAGGATVWFPSGTYNFTTCSSGKTLAITASGVDLVGTSGQVVLHFNNTSCDDIKIGYQTGQIASIGIRDLYFNHSGKTGGYVFNVKNVAYFYPERVQVSTPYNGIYTQQVNTVTAKHVAMTGNSGAYGWRMFDTAGSGQRSDGITLFDVTINPLYSGADCIVIDGPVYSVRGYTVPLLSCSHSLWVKNTAASSSDIPESIYFDDLETDGASTQSIRIDGGRLMRFVNSDISNTSSSSGSQGNADIEALTINPDTGHSDVQQIFFTNSRIGNTRRSAAVIGGQNVYFDNVVFNNASKAGSNSYPAVEIAATAKNVYINGGAAGPMPSDGTGLNSYGVQCDSGATNIRVTNIDLKGSVSGPYNWACPNAGSSISNFLGSANATIDNVQNYAGKYNFRVSNLAAGSGIMAEYDWSTGTGNSFATATLNDNSGTPYFGFGFGSAVAYTYWNASLSIGKTTTPAYKLDVYGTIGGTTLTSTVSTGTAPLTVSSTTNVANLNASSLNGATFAAPGAIGGGTASTGTFTTVTAPTVQPASGNLNLYSGTGSTVVIGISGAAGQLYVNSVAAQPSSDGGLASGSASARWSAVYLHPATVAALTSSITCGATTEGAAAAVTDANSPTFNAALAGSGSNHMIAYCNGTGWVVH